MIDKLENILKDNPFIERNGNFKIEEKAQDGECELNINTDSKLYEISIKKTDMVNQLSDFFKKDTLTLICDGILIKLEKNEFNISLFELKTTLGIRTLQKALWQLEATYLKLIMFLILFEKIEKFKINLYIVYRNLPNIELSKTSLIEREKASQSDFSKLYSELTTKKFSKISEFPFCSNYIQFVNEKLKKSNVEIKLLKCGDTLKI